MPSRTAKFMLVVNVPHSQTGKHDDAYIRQAAIKYKIPYITTVAAAVAAARGIRAHRSSSGVVRSLYRVTMLISRIYSAIP